MYNAKRVDGREHAYMQTGDKESIILISVTIAVQIFY